MEANYLIEDYFKWKFYSNGPHGLVDVLTGKIWVMYHDVDILTMAQKTFFGKLTTVLYQIDNFKNYDSNLIDNYVCQNWVVPVRNLNHFYLGDKGSLREKLKSDDDRFLVNKITTSKLTIEQMCELQDQLMLYIRILQIDASDDIIDDMSNIFSVELDINIIEKKLKELYIDNFAKSGKERHGCILSLLGCFYE